MPAKRKPGEIRVGDWVRVTKFWCGSYDVEQIMLLKPRQVIKIRFGCPYVSVPEYAFENPGICWVLNGSDEYHRVSAPLDALTQRQWYAGMALQGWLASFAPDCSDVNFKGIATFCHKMADAMIEAENAE